MRRFLLLHYGFETPTAEIMQRWNVWLAETQAVTRDMGHFPRGCEISAAGRQDLPLAADSITGFSLIEAEDMAAAEKIAARNPYISSIRIYEIVGQ